MANNRVQTTITAKDEASKVFKSLGTAIRGNVLAANLMATGITSAMGVASQAVDGLINKFKEASQIQLDNVGLAADISSITGKAFAATREEVRKISMEVEKMGNNFPVADSTIAEAQRGFLDDIYQANKNMGKGIDQITKDAANILPRIAVMAEKSNFSASEAARFSSQFINGQLTEAQMKNLDFFNRNKLFMGTVEKYLKTSGKSLKDLSDQERYNLLQAGLNAQVTTDYVEQAGKTIKGIWNKFTGVLFGENSGILSVFKDLDLKTEGEQSVLSALTESLDLLLGDNGLLNSIGKTLEALGIKFGDPMVGFRNAILGFNKQVTYIRDWFAHLGEAVAFQDRGEQQNIIQGYMKRLQDWFAKTFDISQLGEGASTLLNNATAFLSNVDWSAIFSTIGVVAAKLFNELGEFITKIDFNSLLGLIGKILSGFIVGLGNFLANLDWGTVLSAIGTVLAGIIIGGIVTVSAAIIGSLGLIPIAVGAAITGFIAVVAAKWSEISQFFSQKWAAVQSAASSFIDWVREGWESLLKSAQDKWNGIANAATNLFSSVQNWFSNLTSRIPFIGGSSQPVANKASGNIPSTGILAAAVRESRQMPSGSNLVVANDSEMILNRAQQANLASSLQSTRGGITFSIGKIDIHTQATDAKDIAQGVMKELERGFNQFAQSKLAPTYAT